MQHGARRIAGPISIRLLSVLWLVAALWPVTLWAQTESGGGTQSNPTLLLTAEGTVELARAGGTEWTAAKTNQVLEAGDRLRTGPRSRATVRLSDLSVLRVNEQTTLEIRPAPQKDAGPLLDLKSGSAYFFNREKPAHMQFRTRTVSGAIRGTEFNIETDEDGRTVISLLDGEVALNNEQGDLVLNSGEQGIVDPGQPPRKTALINAINIIQWVLYYPAVLDVKELELKPDNDPALDRSLAKYRRGNLPGALEAYASVNSSGGDSERIYRAALLLPAGQVEDAEKELSRVSSSSELATALRKLISAVKNQTVAGTAVPATASGWLAESYYLQSKGKLEEALKAVREATRLSPEFGFAWIRLAELEFSFGRIDPSRAALERGLEFSPRHAAGIALKGFLLAAQNRTDEAITVFNEAIAADGALASAWLGRGVCRIRRGDVEAGRADLQVAATLEPNRSALRSYLGKAWSRSSNTELAEKELRLAKELDPNDPTPWLYSALLHQQGNEINKAVTELERSKELNDNRSVFRSQLLLDQDRAVRSANLAKIYQDAGMTELSVREASEAVNYDHANYSAHLFLANSYDALRDPKQVNLRYETAWMSELLVANLLMPVGAGNLSQNVSQQEYSRLFDGNHPGVLSGTEYYSGGDWVQYGSQYGNIGNTAYALDAYYRYDSGQRPNNDFEEQNYSAKVKQQVTTKDSVFFQVFFSEIEAGDARQYYNQNQASRTLRIHERQDPNLYAGYHREWSPGIHTLFLAGRLQNEFSFKDPAAPLLINTRTGGAQGITTDTGAIDFDSDLVAYTAEMQQIFQRSAHTLVVGGRYQTGETDTDSFLIRPRPGLTGTTNSQDISPDLERVSAYAYYSWQVIEPLQLSAGLSYDRLTYPDNSEVPPLSSREREKDQLSPKAGFRWTPAKDTTVRGIYSQSLGGVFYDTSVRLEPVQIAGFNQAFRSILPESVAGLVPGSEFETLGLALDQKFNTRTYVNVTGEILRSEGSRTIGTLDAFGPLMQNIPSGVRQLLDYEEKTLAVTLDQLLGEQFAVGARYRVSVADLEDRVPAVAGTPNANFSATANRDVQAILHQARLHALFNHRCGFFSQVESIWSQQSNQGYSPDIPGDDFWQFNVFAGYRFARRHAEVRVGLLNITDQDYRLNPLNLHPELPRERTLMVSCRFYF